MHINIDVLIGFGIGFFIGGFSGVIFMALTAMKGRDRDDDDMWRI